jgi:hypothetical protein
MSSDTKRPFVRVYHDDLMHDYPAIWADDAALATWLRLLVLADKMWPTPPELPRSARGRGLARLVESGLVKQVSKHSFRIKGYDKERQSRQDAARNAAAVRWQMQSHSGSDAPGRPSTEYRSPKTNTERENGAKSPEKRRGLTHISDVLKDVG